MRLAPIAESRTYRAQRRLALPLRLPLALALFFISYWLWGWKSAGLHSLYVLAVSALWLQVVFFKFPKIPFACSYLPGKAKLQVLWLSYFTSFYLYVWLLSVIEKALFLAPQDFPWFFGLIAIFLAGFKFYNDHIFSHKTVIVYDDEPEPVMVTM